LNWVTFNVGYHNEHHDLMNIPGWKLPVIKRTAPEFYAGLVSHRSWAWVLAHFVMNPDIGHDSRMLRKAPKGDQGSSPLPKLLVTSEGQTLWKLPA
jgi:sphingolipid delta-4 desaturase